MRRVVPAGARDRVAKARAACRVAIAAVALLLVWNREVSAQQEQPAEPRAAAAPPPDSVPDTWGSGSPAPPETEAKPDPAAEVFAPRDPTAPPESPEPVPEAQRPPERRGSRRPNQSIRYTLENIEVRGNIRSRARVVLRYLPFKPGDIIDVDDPEVELARYRLLGTGFFRDVQFSLRKGSQRGNVVLIVEVVERNTIIVNNVWMGLSVDADTRGKETRTTSYAGLDLAETNLAGSGITLGGALGIAPEQLALRLRFLDPAFLGGHWMTTGTVLYNSAKDFFGNEAVRWENQYELSDVPRSAVVRYDRIGGSIGVGRDLSVSTQLWAHYRLESIEARVPTAASHLRGSEREPIVFDIQQGRSVLSTLRAVVQHDTRDSPFLPTRGWFVTLAGELALSPSGSDYGYQRLEIDAARWWTLPWAKHVLRLEMFGGAISGDAPFFEQFYVNDFTDFRPKRVLGLNFDRRPPPDFLHTSILEVRRGHYAGKLGLEYRIPLYRGHRSVYGIDLFAGFGAYGLASQHDLSKPPRGYSGLARVPIDLTGNIGFRMDTSAGGFTFSFANVVGLLPALSEGQE